MNELSRWFDRLRMSIAILEDADFEEVRLKIITVPVQKDHGVWMWRVSVEGFVPAPGEGFGSREVKYEIPNMWVADMAHALKVLYENNLRKIAEKYGDKPAQLFMTAR